MLAAPDSQAARLWGEGTEAVGRGPERALHFLQRDAFSEARPARQDATPADDGLEIFATSGEALECVEIARRVAGLVEGGLRFDQIAVLLRSPERYGAHLREALRRAAIPAFFTRSANRPDPAGRAFLVLLECAENGLRAADFAEYLSLGQAPRDVQGPMRWEALVVEGHIGGRPDRWRSRLAALEETLRVKREAADEAGRERLDRDLDALDSLREFAQPLIERLAALPRRGPLGRMAGHAGRTGGGFAPERRGRAGCAGGTGADGRHRSGGAFQCAAGFGRPAPLPPNRRSGGSAMAAFSWAELGMPRA